MKASRTALRLFADALLRRRTLLIAEALSESLAVETIAKILYLVDRQPQAGITLLLRSPGGPVTPALALHDTLRGLACPVRTHAIGPVGGTAVIVLASGTKGHRSATRWSPITVTSISAETGVEVAAVERRVGVVAARLADATGQSDSSVRSVMSSGRSYLPVEASGLGYIDRVSHLPIAWAA